MKIVTIIDLVSFTINSVICVSSSSLSVDWLFTLLWVIFSCFFEVPGIMNFNLFWMLHIFVFFFFLIYLFCLFLFLAALGLVAARGLSLVAASRGYSLLRCTGFSLWWLLLLWSMGSRCVGFSSCGTWARWLWRVGSRAQAP